MILGRCWYGGFDFQVRPAVFMRDGASILEQINFKTLAPALNGESESRLGLCSGQCFARSEHFNLFKVKML